MIPTIALPQGLIATGDAREAGALVGPVGALVTSVPFFGLRSYSDDEREIGREESVEQYIAHLVECFRSVKWARPASLLVEIGDVYAKRKRSLLGVPWRFALAMMEVGFEWRNALVWHRSNVVPESATDRFTRSWSPLLLFQTGRGAYFGADREPAEWARWGRQTATPAPEGVNGRWQANPEKVRELQQRKDRHPRDFWEYFVWDDFWSVPSNRTPTPGHFAVMPLEVARRAVRPLSSRWRRPRSLPRLWDDRTGGDCGGESLGWDRARSGDRRSGQDEDRRQGFVTELDGLDFLSVRARRSLEEYIGELVDARLEAALRRRLPHSRLVTFAKAAELTGVSVAALRSRARRGRVRVIAQGRSRLVDLNSFDGSP